MALVVKTCVGPDSALSWAALAPCYDFSRESSVENVFLSGVVSPAPVSFLQWSSVGIKPLY